MRKEVFLSFPDEFIIFDTEFTAWENSMATNWGEPWEKREFVQIGGLKIKKEKSALKVIEKISIYLKPVINPVLSDYFVSLTGITQAKIEKEGLSFIDAMSRFYKFSKVFIVSPGAYTHKKSENIVHKTQTINMYIINIS